jgi:hypothetical protein
MKKTALWCAWILIAVTTTVHGEIKISASLKADPASYFGISPVIITFKGEITVNAPCTVQYQFVRSDGIQEPLQTLKFTKRGSLPVSTTWTVKGPNGWTSSGRSYIQVLQPTKVQSSKAEYKVEFAPGIITSLPETDDRFQFLMFPDRNIYVVKKSGTASHTTEIAFLKAASKYKNTISFSATGLHETDETFEFLLSPKYERELGLWHITAYDIFAIKKRNTGSHTTEIHALSSKSGYKNFSLQTGTVLYETDKLWQFLIDGDRNVIAVFRSNSAGRQSEVHILSAAKNYQKFKWQTETALYETYDSFQFLVKAGRTVNPDITAIKKWNTGSHRTEIHTLAEAGKLKYNTFSLQTATALPETDNTFEFLMASNGDLFAIKKKNTASHFTEIYILTKSSNYKKFGQ